MVVSDDAEVILSSSNSPKGEQKESMA